MISLKLETLFSLIWGCRTAFETWRMCASMLSPIWLFANPWTVTCQSPSSVEFSKQEHWSGCHFLLQGIFLSQGLNLNLLHWMADSLPLHHLGSTWNISSVQFNHSVMSDSLQPHGLQHTRPPCPSPTPGVYSNLRPLSQWCHPTISSPVVPFSSRLQSFPASESFQMSQFFSSGVQSTGVSASTSVLSENTQDWFPLGWTGWVYLQLKRLWRVFSNTTVQKHQFFFTQLSL